MPKDDYHQKHEGRIDYYKEHNEDPTIELSWQQLLVFPEGT